MRLIRTGLITTLCLAFSVDIACAQQTDRAISQLQPAPVEFVPPLLSRADMDRAVAQLDGIIASVMKRTGVPGIAVAVVYRDETLYAKGLGVRKIGKPDPVDTDTVFLLASVSKPIASTIIATQVGQKRFGWHDPIHKFNPDFALSDPYVTRNATFADMLSHRAGLNTGAGDLLEDLGFDRDTILSRLDQEPLNPFRSTYHYSNFGYTEAGEAAAKVVSTTWEDLAEKVLFQPLGMTRSSYRHKDYLAYENRAYPHVQIGDPADKIWQAKYDRDPDAEAPAGGASASINDLALYVRLQLNEGRSGNAQIVDPVALAVTHEPQMIRGPPASPKARGHFYGLGWNVSYDDKGRVRLGHTGAFNLGAATNITIMPGEAVGIAVLTNGEPIGVAEAIAETFFDVAQNGASKVDWLGFTGRVFERMRQDERATAATGAVPANAKPARPRTDYTGVYANSYYGPLTVRTEGDGLVMSLGPKGSPATFPLKHVDGDRFVFETTGENANGLSDAVFATGPAGVTTSITLGFYNTAGLGTFQRQ